MSSYKDGTKLFSRVHPTTPDEEIVIAGMAGRFPNSHDIDEYKHNLYNKIDMVDEEPRRFRHTNVEIPKRAGKIYDLEMFDAAFFDVPRREAHTMDPQIRILMEHAYESVLDAGVNPESLRGSNTAVIVGACFAESEKHWFYDKVVDDISVILTCIRSMMAHRLSAAMDLRGPSIALDTACSSSLYAIDLAFSLMRSGQCDSVIIGTSNLILHPYCTLQFARLGVLATDGYCRPFDDNASGYTRSEANSCIFLQKAKNAKRIYSSLLYSKSNCDGYKEEGITYPSGAMQKKLLNEFYSEVGIKPEFIDYVEAHSTGTVVGDPEECAALDSVFCTNRTKPLPVGSVKSNIGHTEPAAGICSIVKAMLAFETGYIAPNINITKVRTSIESLQKKRLEVVTDVQKLDGPLIGINGFGFGGANAHSLYKRNKKEKINFGIPDDELPRLVLWAGRTVEAVNTIFDKIAEKPLDAEYVGLIHNVQRKSIPGMFYRGFGLFNHVNGENANCLTRDIKRYGGYKRPIAWVFSGIGSEWQGMGSSLLNIPIFRKAIEKCQKALDAKKINLFEILTLKKFDNILSSAVGLVAMQIGLVDILNEVEVKAEFFVGHSLGELGCAYADGCLTAEQTILAAYAFGRISSEMSHLNGLMVEVSTGYRKISQLMPNSIEVAYFNSPDSCTITGQFEDVKKFVEILKSNKIITKIILNSNIPYHSKYALELSEKFLKELKEIIPEPKLKSEKWLSSSIPKVDWNKNENKFASAEYFANNFIKSVLFDKTCSAMPNNVLTIEIAPHHHLQKAISKSMPLAANVNLLEQYNSDSVQFLLISLGKIYQYDVDLAIDRLYPEIEFPVSRGTPMLSSQIKWDHSQEFFVTKFETQSIKSGERIVKLTLSDLDYEFICGHMIDGRVLVPATSYIFFVWETLAIHRSTHYFDLKVEFSDVRFLRATNITKDITIEFSVLIQSGTGYFEITEGNEPVVTGYVNALETVELTDLPDSKISSKSMLPQKDFYKELRLRGYHYSGAFKAVLEAQEDGLYGKVKWEQNWIAFMDCLLQIHIVGKDTRSLMLPTRIEKLTIDPKYHVELIRAMDSDKSYFDVKLSKYFNLLQSGGIEIKGLHASIVGRRRPPGYPVLESYKFIPNLPTPQLSKTDAVRVIVQLALENIPKLKVKAAEILGEEAETILEIFQEALGDLPLITSELTILTKKDIKIGNITVENANVSTQTACYFIIANEILANPLIAKEATPSLIENGFLVSRENLNLKLSEIEIPAGFQLLSVCETDNEYLLLLQMLKKNIAVTPKVIKLSSEDTEFTWIDTLRTSMKNGPVILLAEKDNLSGIIGLVNCIRKEPDGNMVTCVFVDDKLAPDFDIENPYYKQYLKLGLAINVWRNGKWGTYRHLQIKTISEAVPTKTHCFANVLTQGDLSSLSWMNGPLSNVQTENIIWVQYASMNFRDVMLATGKISAQVIGSNRIDQECVLGFEYAGSTLSGRKMFGMVISGALATHVDVNDSVLAWDCPEMWTLQEAATVPVVYITVYLALVLTARVKKGNSVLIHAGSGGVGLAAIRVSFAYGLDVYTTVSTPAKKKFLLETFPQLKESHIGNSRDISFEKMVMLETKGKGVDYVLNSLSEEKLFATIRCLGVGGQFLEIGKFDLSNDTKIGMAAFDRQINFHAILADNLFRASQEQRQRLIKLISEGMKSGIVVPLKSEAFPAGEIEQAFRHLASGKHVGKVLLKMREHEHDTLTYPIKVIPRVYCDPKLSYVIPGGLGGFGLELADWLVVRGAKKIVFSSSRGISKAYQTYRINIWKTYDVQIIINTSNIATKRGCIELIQEANALGPVGGIFNLAVVLRDSILENQTPEAFTESMAPKATATKYLDEISRILCLQLKHFVIFSSVSCGRGNAGQSNYGMSNSVMERIIEQRVNDGLPGKAIQWGAVGEVGLVADMQELHSLDMEIGGTLQQRISSCLTEMDALMLSDEPVVSSMVVAEKRAGSGADDNIVQTVMNIMSIRDIKSISMDASLSELGMDSLMAVEIKQTLERKFELSCSPQELRSLTFLKLESFAESRENEADGQKERSTGLSMLQRNIGDEKDSEHTLLGIKSETAEKRLGVPTILVSGIEGVAGNIWKIIASKLDFDSSLLQLTKTINLKTAEGIVAALLPEIIEELFKNSKNFYLVGYSFGSVITLELARVLENAGMSGHVVIIDGGAPFLQKLALNHLKADYNEEMFQLFVISEIIRIVYPDEILEDLYGKLSSVSGYEEKLDTLVSMYKNSNYSDSFVKKSAIAFSNRLKLVLELDTSAIKPIKSSITLLRPSEVSVVDIEEDYEMSKYTTGKVDLHILEGDHMSILDNPKLISILNDKAPIF